MSFGSLARATQSITGNSEPAPTRFTEWRPDLLLQFGLAGSTNRDGKVEAKIDPYKMANWNPAPCLEGAESPPGGK